MTNVKKNKWVKKSSTSLYLSDNIKDHLIYICEQYGESQSEVMKRLIIAEFTKLQQDEE